MRVAVFPVFRGEGVTEAQARQLDDALTVALVSDTGAESLPAAALDAGPRPSRVRAIVSLLGEGAPSTAVVRQLGTLATAAKLGRVLLVRADATRSGGRVLFMVVAAGGARAIVAAELPWSGTFGGPPPGWQAAVRASVAPGPVGRALAAKDWPAGAVPVQGNDAPKPRSPPEPGATVAGGETDPPKPKTPLGVTAEARTNYYADNDGNRIVTPTLNVSGAVSELVTIAGHAAVDMMTCASVDVVSAATPKGYFQENRKEYGGSVTLKREQLGVTVGAVRSVENDYASGTASFAVSDEFLKRNVTLSLAYSFTGSRVGRVYDPNFARRLDSHALTLGYVQVLSKHWVGQLSGFIGILSGFQSSVYRMVHFSNGASGPEVAPDLRIREALGAELKGALSQTWFTGASYRFYIDSWGLLAHTAEVTLTWAPRDWLSVRLRDRGYTQHGSSFYRSVYDRPMRYMTIDRELGGLRGNLVGAKIAVDLGGPARATAWQLDLKYDWMWQHFDDFPWLTDRYLSMVEAGLHCAF